MVGGQENVPANLVSGSVGEAGTRRRDLFAALREDAKAGVEGKRAERHQNRIGCQ